MPEVTGDQALALLTSQVRDKFATDELLEVYNEVFPKDPYTLQEANRDSAPLVERLVEYINSGLEGDEIIDLWGLIFPRHRNRWYDEEEERIHYDEEAEVLPAE